MISEHKKSKDTARNVRRWVKATISMLLSMLIFRPERLKDVVGLDYFFRCRFGVELMKWRMSN
jgi:hypothetical protein